MAEFCRKMPLKESGFEPRNRRNYFKKFKQLACLFDIESLSIRTPHQCWRIVMV